MTQNPADTDDNVRESGAWKGASKRLAKTPFLQRVIDTTPDGIIAMNEDGIIVFANQTIADVFDSSPDELVDRPLTEFLVDDQRAELLPVDHITNGESDEADVQIRNVNDREITLHLDIRDLAVDGDRLFVGFVRDHADNEKYDRTIDRYEAIAGMTGYGIYQLDQDGHFEMVNETVVDKTGYSREELLGAHTSKLLDEEAIGRCENAVQELLESEDETVATLEFNVYAAGGEPIPCEARITPLRSDGTVQGTVGVIRDVSERKERIEDLRQERGLIEHVLETSPVGIGVITPDGDISRVNDRAEELLGLTMAEITSQTLDVSQRQLYDAEGEQVPPEDLLSRVFDEGEQVLNSEFTLERPDGDRVWAAISIAPMIDDAGDVEKAVIIATDVTERKEREETLKEERDIIEHILETSPVGIGVITPDGDISRVNDRAEELFGLTDYELSNRTLDVSQRQLYDPEGERVSPEELLSRVFNEGEQVINSEFKLERPDGDRVWAAISIAPLTDDAGDVDKAVIIGKDITDRKRREDTLRGERDVIEHILETSPVGIGVITPDGDISRVNDQAEKLLGLTIEEITSQTLDVSQRRFYGASGQQIQPEDLLSRVFDDRERVLNSEFRLERPDGERVWTALSMAPIESREGDIDKAVVIATDISERKERERRLRESEARLRQIAENINNAIWMADDDLSEVLYINPAYETITGRSRDSVYDNLMNHLNAVYPQDQHRVEQAMREVTQTSQRNARVLRFQEKYRIVRPDGAVRWVNSFAFPLQDDDGEVYRFVGVIDDITEVKEQQLELGRQRDELETLNQINTVIRRVNQGLVRAATREEIEHQVCETLTDSKLYHTAWIGEVEGGLRDVEPKTGTGISEESLDASVNVESINPIATAIESGDIQIIRDISDLPAELAADGPDGNDGFGSGQSFAAVIPVGYKETTYDVLVAYSSRANAFSVREQAVLLELGKTIGLAINAVERKDALLTDTVIELEFEITDPKVFFVRVSAETGIRFELEGITSQSDGSYLQYFTMSDGSPEKVLDLAQEDKSIKHVRLVTENNDTALLEFIVTGPSLTTTLAEYGATVHTATIADGTGMVLAALPQTANVRNVVDVVQSTFTESELVSKRTRERSVQTSPILETILKEKLTERQEATLETAYYAGYFEWPRDSSGEEVAESIGIAPATFHQHVRGGVRALLETLVNEAKIPHHQH